jgi:ceramide glucosyltransferase
MELLTTVLRTALLGLTLTTVLFYGACTFFTLRFFKRQNHKSNYPPQPVSVLIPVRGLDEGAAANWQSFCCQEYDCYEVLFGVMDPDDPAVPVLQEFVAQYPDRVRLVTGLEARGINHQISNLSYLVEAAQ